MKKVLLLAAILSITGSANALAGGIRFQTNTEHFPVGPHHPQAENVYEVYEQIQGSTWQVTRVSSLHGTSSYEMIAEEGQSQPANGIYHLIYPTAGGCWQVLRLNNANRTGTAEVWVAQSKRTGQVERTSNKGGRWERY